MDDLLDRIMIRAQDKKGKWENMTLREVDDKQFAYWVFSKLGLPSPDVKISLTDERRTLIIKKLLDSGIGVTLLNQ